MRPLLVLLLACSGPTAEPGPPLQLRAISFNTGTTEGLDHDGPPDDGYGSEEALISDQYYGDGLAFEPVIDHTAAWLAAERPDLIGFQELFWSGECPSIPAEHHPGWACEGWQPGDPTVAERILGPDYQIACHRGKADKCLAVHRDFGTIRGCDRPFCLDALDGAEVSGCGSGSRVGRAEIDLAAGGELTVVNVHGSSGLTPEDRDCRVRQFQLVFEDLDGEPGISGARNLILGDFNTDPGRNGEFDPSAAYLADQTASGPMSFITEVGPEAEPTYAGLFNIDHILADSLTGTCRAGPIVSPNTYFDHLPMSCDLSE